MEKFLKLPASDVASWIGFAVGVVAVLAIAKRVPFVKTLV